MFLSETFRFCNYIIILFIHYVNTFLVISYIIFSIIRIYTNIYILITTKRFV